MRLSPKNCTLTGAEGSSPPLPFIEVDDAEGAALVAIGVATIYGNDGQTAVEPPTPVVSDPGPDAVDIEPDVTAAELGVNAEPEPDEPSVGAEQPAAGESSDEPAAAELTERQAAIAEVFDILEAGDLVKTGARAGKPKVSAIEAATGLADVTADEVDALFDART